MSPTREEKYLLRQNPWYQAAVGSAIVSCVFTVALVLLLSHTVYQLKVTDPQRADVLTAKKQQYESQPANEDLLAEIRRMDREIRRDQFARMQFVRRGAVLLMVFVTIFIGSLLWMQSFSKQVSVPDGPVASVDEQKQAAFRSRAAVTFSMILLSSAALFVVLQNEVAREATASEGTTPTATPQAAPAPVPAFASMEEAQDQWPVFRGPGGLGICTFENIPSEWDGPSGKSILWKTPVPLGGHNSPVVWEGRVFLTGASEDKRQLYCFDADSGTLLWTGDVPASTDPALGDLYIMEDTGHAASTAAVNGTFAAAIFVDGQVGCFDMDGKLQWTQSLGVPESAYGYASSLTFYEDRLIVQLDQTYDTDKSFLIALDFATGETLWRTPRPVPNSWTSPTVANVGDAYQVLTSGAPWVIGYDPKTGEELWKVECLDGDVAPTQVVAGGKVFAVEPYSSMTAVDPAAAEGERIAWQADGDMPDICSPLAAGGLVWTLTGQGDLACWDAADGSEIYNESLDAMFQASPSLVGERLYLLSEEGRMTIAGAGRTFETIGHNELGEKTLASPAFAPGRIYLRGIDHLYCIGTQP